MKLVSLENLSKYNELLNQKTVKTVNSIKPDSNGNVNISSNDTNIVGVTNNRNLGEIFYSALPRESSQVHLLDGSILTDSTELYDYLESIKDSNPDLFTTDSEFNSEVESTGKCTVGLGWIQLVYCCTVLSHFVRILACLHADWKR